jgi:hypothetical protein
MLREESWSGSAGGADGGSALVMPAENAAITSRPKTKRRINIGKLA